MTQWIERPKGAAPLFDGESGKKAAKQRWAKQREKVQTAQVKALQDAGYDWVHQPDDVVAELGAQAIVSAHANMMEKPSRAVTAGKFGLELAGLIEQKETQRRAQGPAISIEISNEAVALALASRIHEVIEGDVTEVDDDEL